MLALHVLHQREGLAQGSQSALDAGLPVDLRRRIFRLEECADGPCDVLRDGEHLFRDVLVTLQRLERRAERFTRFARLAGR